MENKYLQPEKNFSAAVIEIRQRTMSREKLAVAMQKRGFAWKDDTVQYLEGKASAGGFRKLRLSEAIALADILGLDLTRFIQDANYTASDQIAVIDYQQRKLTEIRERLHRITQGFESRTLGMEDSSPR